MMYWAIMYWAREVKSSNWNVELSASGESIVIVVDFGAFVVAVVTCRNCRCAGC